jgi:hypothetical protein
VTAGFRGTCLLSTKSTLAGDEEAEAFQSLILSIGSGRFLPWSSARKRLALVGSLAW